MSARELDDLLVPRAARRLRRAVGAGRSSVHEARQRLSALAGPLPPGAAPGPLRRLDDRFARRGPLGVVRRSPRAGVLAVATVLLAGTAVAVVGPGEDDRAGTGTAVQLAASTGVLGPAPGTSVPEYLARSRTAVAELSREDPDARSLGLVSLSAYVTPEQAGALAEGLEVVRAYLRAPGPAEGEVLEAEVRDLVPDLRLLCAATARRKAEDRLERLAVSRSVEATTPAQQRYRDENELAAIRAGREAAVYGSGCATVVALLVRGTSAELAELPALQGVRGVEPAPDTGAEVRVQLLLPEQTDRVAAGAAPRPRTGG